MESTKKIALVTGANRGIGFETARQLARNGFTVLLAARSLQEARTAVAELEKLAVVSAIPVELDITSATDREGISRLISERFGRLDVLVNNGAIGTPEGYGSVSDALTSGTSLDELRQVFETNLFAVLLLTQELLPLLKRSPAGRIVNVSSQLGSLTLHARRDQAVAYNKRFSHNASKAALNLFTILLAQELEGTNLKINSVHPGWVKTRLGTDAAPLEAEQGARTSVKAALLDEDGPSGAFFHEEQIVPW